MFQPFEICIVQGVGGAIVVVVGIVVVEVVVVVAGADIVAVAE
jgi:hypothetical protein